MSAAALYQDIITFPGPSPSTLNGCSEQSQTFLAFRRLARL